MSHEDYRMYRGDETIPTRVFDQTALGSDLCRYYASFRKTLPTFETFHKHGITYNVSSGNLPQDLSMAGGTYTGHPYTLGETVHIFSTSASDSALGTGARTVEIKGLDTNRFIISEIITMNGTTPVVSANIYTRVDTLTVLTAGSTGKTVGTIYARHSVTTANVFVTLPPGINRSTNSFVSTPTSRSLILRNIQLNIVKFSAPASPEVAEFTLFAKEGTKQYSAYEPYRRYHVYSSNDSATVYDDYVFLDSGVDAKFTVTELSGNNIKCSARFDVYMVDSR